MKRSVFVVLTLLFIQTLFTPAAIGPAMADQGRWLAREQIVLYGLGLNAEPAHQTVPRDIATIVSTYLQAPDSIPAGTLPIPAAAEVRATLRGPSLSKPVELVTAVNGQFEIQPLPVAGIHTLENIRIVYKGEVILYAAPESVTIEVIDKLLVTEITAKPLTAQEIKDKGIVFDRADFQAYNFTAAFAVQPGEAIQVDFPVLLPTLASAQGVDTATVDIPGLKSPRLQSIATIIPDTLKVARTQIPNLMVKGFAFTVAEEVPGSLEVPPIPGVIVIPGDIGFLNQYFSVMLMVGNAAPEGSGLIVQDLQAEIILPAGSDTVVGSGDDPLQMAATQTGANTSVQPVVKPGADAQLGTADDEDFIAPGETGHAEFLVEGRREGTHVIEMDISGTLRGLPVGPVEVRGRSAGAVLVRNPAFTLTFTHPEVVNAGESYDLDVTVTNTSESPANFVNLSLYPRNISGAALVGEPTREVETIAPGDSAVVSFRLQSYVTGTVFATTLDSEEKIAGRFELKAAVGELGIPLSPDSLVLPKAAGSLPPELRSASIALLGKAYAAATAPAGTLPGDVQRFSKNMVWDKAVEAARAGLRYTLHEPLANTAMHLLLDFAGGNYARLAEEYAEPDQADELAAAKDDFLGFDDLRRRSFRGDVFAAEIAEILADDLTTLGVSDFHSGFAETVSFRPAHLSVVIGTDGAPLPFRLTLTDDQGLGLGEYDADNHKIIKEIPFSEYLTFTDAGGNTTAQMALVLSPQAVAYTVRLERNPDAAPGTPFSLSVVLPADSPSRLRQVVFAGITGDNGVPEIQPIAGDPFPVSIEMVANGQPISGETVQPESASAVMDPPPAVFSAVQMADADLICKTVKVGRVAAVLFSEEVTSESIQHQFDRIDINNYAPENNAVVGVALQPGGRIAYLALRDPVGPFIERQMTILNASDLRGQTMTNPWTGPIEPTIIDEPYGVVSGKVLNADGAPIPDADVRLFKYCADGWVGISAKSTDADGSYIWDFVLPGSKVVAVDQETGEFRSIPFTVQRHGQRLNLNIVFLGRGTLQGRAVAEDGFTLLPDTRIKVTSLTDYSEYGAATDKEGKFVIPGIPVGSILIEAVNITYDDAGQVISQSKLSTSDRIRETGAVLERDLVLLGEDSPQQAAIAYGRVSGHVLESDGLTPIQGVPVVVYYRSNSQEGLACPLGTECAVAMAATGPEGSFLLEEIPAGDLRIYTFEQSRLLEGEAWITLAEDAEARVNVLLSGGLGTVSGVVLDADGNPVAGAMVGGGMSLTTTDENGRFVMADVPVGGRQIVAVSEEIGSEGRVTVNLTSEGDEVGATITLDGVGRVAGTIYETDGITAVADLDVYLFYISEASGSAIVVAQAVTDSQGRFIMERVPINKTLDYTLSAFRPDFSAGDTAKVALKFHGQTATADIIFKGSGQVSGQVFDDDGQTPLAARVSLSALRVVRAGPIGTGFKYIEHVKILENDPTTGAFTFNNVFMGNFVITAAGPFSPDPIAAGGIMPADGATVEIALQLQPTSEITGTVYQAGGATPAGEDIVVTFRGFKLVYYPNVGWVEEPHGVQEEIVATDANGRFRLPVVNAGRYSITAHDPATGKIGEIKGMLRAGQTDDVALRLLGLGDVTIRVLTSQGDPVPAAVVNVQQSGIKDLERNGTADAAGEITFTLPEGTFTVLARNLQNGFAGRAPGEVTEDGEQLVVDVYLWDATGTVSGTVLSPDGITPVPNAEVMLANLQGPLGMVTSDDAGHYSMETVPLGDFEVQVFEAATGRTGLEQGTIYLDGQEVTVNIALFPVGYVTGNVLSAADHTPVEGYRVMIIQPDPLGRSNPLNCGYPDLTWFGTTGVDGGFAFPGIQQGAFEVIVGKRGLGPIGCGSTFDSAAQQTSVESRITYEGEAVDIPVLVDLAEPPEGTVMGWVYNPDGTPAGDISVSGIGMTTTDAQGAFVYKHVPLGRYYLRAESQVTHDRGYAQTEVAFGGQTAYVQIVLKGLADIAGRVVDDAGNPAGDVRVTLHAPGQTALTIFADPAGVFSFAGVPSGKFTILAEDTVTHISGSAGGILTPGGSVDVRVVLEPTESVTGTVRFADQRPAPGIAAELTGSEDSIYGETDTDGRFTFDAVPAGAYTLLLEDPIGEGLAALTLSVVDTAVDLGDIVLDASRPEVVSIDPMPGAVNVALDRIIRVAFSKPILRGTVNPNSVTLTRDDGRQVTGILAVEAGDTAFTLTPLAPLDDEARYTLRISAAPAFDNLDIDSSRFISRDEAVRYFPLLTKFDEYDTVVPNGLLSRDEYPAGVQDRLGRVMREEFVASFSTVDITAPAVLNVSPSPDSGGVAVDSVIRIGFSEPVAPAAFAGDAVELTLAQSPVAGRVDMILGNTAVVFTPDQPLAVDSIYRVTVRPATDLSGNLQAEGLTYEFSTTDRTPPVVEALMLSNNGTVVEGGAGAVGADVGAAFDLAWVDFYLNGTLVFTDRQPPFEMHFEAQAALGAPGDLITVAAAATDTSGNRGAAVSSAFEILADAAPSVTVSAVSTGSAARTGQRVELTVAAEDDLGVTTIAFQAEGGASPAFGTVFVDPSAIASEQQFAFYIPVDAVPGSTITIHATAVDTRGQAAEAAPVEITVLDATDPVAGFEGMTTGDRVAPGEVVTAVVSAHDLGGVAVLTLQVSGASTYFETRALSPARETAAETFTFTVAPSAAATENVLIQAIAVDQAGNSSPPASVTLPVADVVPPVVVALETETGATTMVPGETVTIHVAATDEVGVASIQIEGSGAFSYTETQPIMPPSGDAQAVFTINVPDSLTAGDVIDLQARAVDLSGNLSLPVMLSLSAITIPEVALPPSILMLAGDAREVDVQLAQPAPSGGLDIDFTSEDTGIATVDSSLHINEGQTSGVFTVNAVSGGNTVINAAIQGFHRSSLTVAVQGGVVSGTVYSPAMSPVSGAVVNVNGREDITDGDGRFLVQGVVGFDFRYVRIQVLDLASGLQGYHFGAMNAVGGFLRGVAIVLTPAGSLTGTAVQPDGQTPAGEGIKVELFRAGNPGTVVDYVFTDADSRFEFPIVALGDYALKTSDTNGNRGLREVVLSEAGQEVATVVAFLGRGAVTGSVVNAYGEAVANAQVRLWGGSIFGYENRSVTAGQDGTFAFDGIFVGTFSVTAEDSATHMAAKQDGTIDQHGQSVDLTLQLGAWATLEGTVYRAEGSTTVSGARVTVGNVSTTTDVDGRYRFEVLPLGTYTVTATELATRGVGRDAITLDTLGETGQLNIFFAGQGTLIVTVEDFNGNPVDGASIQVEDTAEKQVPYLEQRQWKILATSDGSGIAVIPYVGEGIFDIEARMGTLTGETTGSLAAGEVLPVTVRLEPVGGIQGAVFEPDGTSPAAGIELRLYRQGSGSFIHAASPDEDGHFAFADLPLDTYRLDAVSQSGQLRARADDLLLEDGGQVVTRDLTLIGLGTVAGRVLMPDGSGAGGLPVTLESHTPVFGRTYATTTDAHGEYAIEQVPVGDFTVSSGNPALQLLGEIEGSIGEHQETVTRDIDLQTNALTLPITLYDGNISRYQLQPDGTMRSTEYLFNTSAGGGCRLEIISDGSTYPFPQSGIATQESAGREIVVRETNLGGLNITRKIYVPEDAYFARYLEILSNTSSVDVTVGLRISSAFYDYYLSSDSPHETAGIVATSSGDEQLAVGLESADLWVTLDDNKPADPFVDTTNNIPPSAFIWGGPDAVIYPDAAVFVPYNAGTSSPANLAVQWSDVTVPAGQSVAFMHFVVPHAGREAARASAERLSAIPPEALFGLSLAEIAMVRNFALPADGASSLASLPTLTEGVEITGRVLASDGLTPPTPYYNAFVYLKSHNIYFSRTYRSGYPDTDGGFAFVSNTAVGSGSAVRIPLEGFSLWATYTAPASGYGYSTIDSPVVEGGFAPASTSATRDVLFTNTGELRGTVLKSTGEPVAGATVRISYNGGPYFSVSTGSDGLFPVPFLLPGDYVVVAYIQPPAGNEGDSLRVDAPAQTVVAGDTTSLTVELPPLGGVAGTLYTGEGLAVANARLTIRETGTSFDRTTYTDATGQYLFGELPVGDYVLTAYDPDTAAPTITSVSIAEGATIAADITLPYTVDLPQELFDGNGFRWDIQTDGRIRYGTDNAYYYSSYGGLDFYRITLPDGYYDDFSGGADAIAEDGGRELLIGPQVFAGRDLEVQRKIFVPADDAFARYLEILENTGTSDLTVSLYVRTYLGSGGGTVIVRTSGGDQSFSVDDDFIITDDEDETGTPTMVHVLSGPGAGLEPSNVEAYRSSTYFRMGYYFDVTIPAGERRIIMHFASQNSSRADALSSAAALHCLQGRALAGLTPEEQAEIVNFVAYPDADCDGLTDEQEISLGTNPNDPDSDGDGLTDKFETDYNLDPLLPGDATGDPDTDGLDNLAEQAAQTNPYNPDSDGDGISDGDEVNIFHTDPTNAVIRINAGIAPSDQADFAIDSLGNIHVVWVDDRHNTGNNNDEIYYTLLNAGGGTLIDDTRLTTDVSRSRRPAIAVDARNRAHIVWQDKRLNNTPEIFYTMIDPALHPRDGSAGDDAAMAVVDDYLLSVDDGDKGDTPRLLVDSRDRVHVVWSETDRGEIQYARLEVDEIAHAVNVILSQVIFSAGEYRWYPAHSDLALDSAENVHVIWMDHRETLAVEIFYEMLDRDTGATRIDETVLTTDDGDDAMYPSLSVGPGDQLTVVFNDYRLGANEVFMLRFNPALDDQDGSPAEVSDIIVLPETLISPADDVDSAVPTGFVDAQGNLHATYFDSWESWESYPAELHLLAADRNGAAVEDTSMTQGTTAITYGTDWTRARVASSGITSYVVWTDNRFGNAEVLLQIVSPDRDKDGLVDAGELLEGTDPDDADSDNDGLLDGFEATNGFNPLLEGEQDQDPDGDTLTNVQEQEARTNPHNPDSDGDGLDDSDELAYGADPNYADTDNDGLMDGDEVHHWSSDPTLTDSDGDGLLDGFEAANGFNPADAGEADDDPDNDGLDNLMEQARLTDPRNPDSDADGAADGDEVYLYGTDPLVPDTDGDGLRDGFEISHGMNPLAAGDEIEDPDGDGLDNLGEQTAGTDPENPDTDGDGLRDGFEVEYGFDPLVPGDDAGDPDGDGLNNLREQSYGALPHIADSDYDMLSDGDEVDIHTTDPTRWDTDSDQLGDGDEVNGTYGYVTDPTNPDTDGGGREDGEEIWTDGTDPTNPGDDQVPVAVTAGEGLADQSAVAVDSTGNIHVVWVDNRSGSYQVFYTLLAADKSTLIDDTRLTDTSSDARHPALALNDPGRVHVVWQDAGTTSTEIFHLALDPSLAEWDGQPISASAIMVVPVHLISSDDGQASTDADLAVDDGGRVHLVFGDTGTGEIHYTRLDVSGAVQVIDQVVFSAGGALTWGQALPKIAVDGNYDAHIVWMDQRDGAIEINYAMLDGSGAAVAATLIDATALTPADGYDSRYPSVGVGPGNEITVVYDSETLVPFLSTYLPGCKVAILRIDPALDDQNGNAAAVGAMTSLPETAIDSRLYAAKLPPSATVDTNGNVYVSYYGFYNAPRGSLNYVVINSSGMPIIQTKNLTEETTATSTEALTLPSVAIFGSDLPATGIITWTDDRSGNPEILLRTVTP